MADCNPSIDSFVAEDVTLEVSEKYIKLMQDSLGEDSIYERTKDTIKELSDDLNLTASERAQASLAAITSMVTSLSGAAMQTALSWAKEEKDAQYTLARLRAETELVMAQYEKAKIEICLADKEKELRCAQITATLADSIRTNGRVSEYGADGCRPISLYAEGLKYEQTQQVAAATYQMQADTYRKSGVVQVGEDANDGVLKGLSGDEYGYTHAQVEFSERQKIAFEDSKISHAVQGSSSMIGQMLTAEIAPTAEDVERWRDAMDKLLTPHSTTSNP